MADALIPEPNIPAPVSNVFSAPTPEAPAPAALTPEELAAFQTSEKEAGVVNPVRDFSAQELADFAIQDPGFNIAETFRNSPDLHGDQALVQKAADALDLVKERGFKLKDLPTAKQAGHAVLEIAKGFGKQVWNYANAAGAAVQSAIADVFGAPGIAEESANEVNRRLAANVAGTEEAMTGLSELGQRAVGKAARLIGGPRTPEQKVADLWSDVGRAEVQQQRLSGQGPFAMAVTGGESAKAGLKPEEVSTLAAGDPFSFYLFGSAAKGVGALVPKGVSTAVAAGTQAATEAAGRAAQIVSGKVLQGAGKAAGGAAGLVEGAAPIVAPIAGAIKGGGLYGPAGVAGGFLAGERAGRILARGARRAGAAAESLETVGREIASSAPVTSTYAQAGRDFLQALPGATFETAKGAALDLGLAAASAETPQETQGAAAFGTVLGGLHGAAKIGGRVISGQLIAPREYGIGTPQPSSKKFAGLDALHNEAFANAEPGVKARLNAMRQFATGTSGADVFYAPEPAKLAAALESTGLSSETAKVWSEQNGFFTAELRDSSGQPRRVLVVTTPDSAPHEALHAIQDVVGEQGNQAIDKIVKDTYAGQWDEMGQDYANRVGVEPGATWQETILDKTGKGLTEAKEKIYRNIYNTLEGQQGAAPSRALVEQLAKEAYGRITDAALEKNPHISPEEVAQHAWREILSPTEAAEAADTYMAREIAADNFDAIFKHTGPSLGEPNSLPSKLARIAGRVIAAFGGEPLAGRTGGAARTPLATPVVEAVRRQAAGLKPEVIVPAPAGRGPIGKAPTGEGDKARKIAEAASDVPTEKGLRSPKELLGDVAAGIEGGNVIKLNYSSAPGPVAADLLSNRTLRRQLIADFNDVPEAQRQLVEKTFTPISLRQTKGGEVQVFGWSPEVFAANAHKMGKFLESRPDLAPLSPYALDATAHSFTPEGWQELYSDVKTVSENHKNGYTGSGESLVVPPEVTAKGKYFAPEVKGTAIPLDQTKADFINMLFNSKLPETALARSEQPLNLAGQRISEATLPGRVTVPVEPVGTFRGKAAERGGITGESVMEVNPVRRSIEAGAGADMPSLIEVNQQLNLSRIKEVEHAPEQQPVTANTLTLQAGFEPGQLIGGQFEAKEAGDMETIRAAAIKWRPTGELFTGFMHSMALDQAFERGVMPGIKSFDDLSQIQREQVGADKQWDSGFFTSKDRFVSRAEAEKIGEAAGQLRAGHVEGERLDSDKVNMVAQFEPKEMTKEKVEVLQRAYDRVTSEQPAVRPTEGAGTVRELYDRLTSEPNKPIDQGEAFPGRTFEAFKQGAETSISEGEYDLAKDFITRAREAADLEFKYGKKGAGVEDDATHKQIESQKAREDAAIDEVEMTVRKAENFFKDRRLAGQVWEAGGKLEEVPPPQSMEGTDYSSNQDMVEKNRKGTDYSGGGIPGDQKAFAFFNNPDWKHQLMLLAAKVADSPNPFGLMQELAKASGDEKGQHYAVNAFTLGGFIYQLEGVKNEIRLRNGFFGKRAPFSQLKKPENTITPTSKTAQLGQQIRSLPRNSLRSEAAKRAMAAGQYDIAAQLEPKAAMEKLKTLSDEEIRQQLGTFKGKNANGLTGWAYEQGAAAKTPEDLQAFRSTGDLMTKAGEAAMAAGQEEKAMTYLVRAQVANEAYEAATGTTITGKTKDVATFIRKHYNPDFQYSMPAVQFEPGEKKAAQTGLEFKKFFSDVTKGTFGKSEKPFQPELDLSGAENFITAKTEHSGNFDDHISKSIPTFYDAQVRKGNAILETYPDGARVLDIAASEGSFDKALSQLSDGKIETISLDPNPDMAKFFAEKSQVPGASYVEEAFLNGFEDNGKTIPAYNPTEKFDVVNESMGFQFIDPDRGAQIAEAKRMLNPDGVFLTEEKVRNPEWAANEKTKDTQHKNKYFTPVELKAKDEKVGFSQSKQETKAVGMVDNMAQQADLEQILKDNFKHVVQYWDSGNFKGYAASDNAAAVNRLVENMGDLNSKFSTVETPREVSGAEEFEFQNRQGQFEPKPKKKDDLKFKPGASGFSKAWILPNGTPVQLGGTWHHQWLSENPDVAKKYGLTVPKFTGGDAEGVREDALKKGFARVNYNQNTGEVTVEARAQDWRKQRDVVQDMIERNLDNVDRMTVNLMDANAQKMVDTDTKTLFNLDTDAEKMANLPFISTGEIRGGQFEPGEYWVGKGKINRAEEGHYEWASEKFGMRGHTAAYKAAEDAGYLRTVVGYGNDPIYVDPTGKFKAWEDIPKGDRNNIEDMAFEHNKPVRFGNAEVIEKPRPEEPSAQFEPKKEEETLFGAGAVEYPGNAAVANMTKAELADRFPEVVIPKRRDDPIPSGIVDSPLFKQAGSEAQAVDAFADRLVEFAKENEADPAFKAGAEWYSEFVPKLKKEFGKDAQVMAELLAATSPQTAVGVNFGYAFDALQSLKSGRFDKTVTKFKEGLTMMDNGKWLNWYNKENAAGNIPKPPKNPTLPAFLEAWINKHDLKPRQSNGALYGTHSIPVLQVFARKWLTESRGPKTLNFVKNLVGTSNESTIDLWADRTMRRVGYSGFKERWRILPGNVQGVSDADFSFSQKAFRKAAEQLDMKPDALQGALWFAEKKLWHDKGWGRLDLGDFQTELKKIPALKQAYGQRLAATKQRAKEVAVETPDLFAVEPRNLRK